MTTTVSPLTARTISTQSTRRSVSSPTPLWRVGLVGGVAAAAATTVVALAARAVDIPMMAAPNAATAAKTIPTTGYAMGTLMCTAIGTVLAIALARWTPRPAQLFVAATIALTVVSFAGPITTSNATTATRLVLALTHVVAAAIVIPALARRLAP